MANAEFNERMSFGEERLRMLCAERGLDWDLTSEDDREAFVDALIHEDRQWRREFMTQTVITSRQNSRVKLAVALRAGRERRKQGRFLIDGERETARALACGVKAVEVFVREGVEQNSSDPFCGGGDFDGDGGGV